MEALSNPTFVAIVVVSELVAAYVLWRIWTSSDFLFLKISRSLIAVIPIFGPILALWLGSFPSAVPRIMQDQQPRQANFYDRWRHVFEEKNPIRRFLLWRELMTRDRNEDP
jgi:hypothetical protein